MSYGDWKKYSYKGWSISVLKQKDRDAAGTTSERCSRIIDQVLTVQADAEGAITHHGSYVEVKWPMAGSKDQLLEIFPNIVESDAANGTVVESSGKKLAYVTVADSEIGPCLLGVVGSSAKDEGSADVDGSAGAAAAEADTAKPKKVVAPDKYKFPKDLNRIPIHELRDHVFHASHAALKGSLEGSFIVYRSTGSITFRGANPDGTDMTFV